MTRKETAFSAGPEGTTLTTASSGASQVTLNSGSGVYAAATKGSSGALSTSGGFGAKFTNAANQQALARVLGAAANAKYGFNFIVTLPAELDANNITFGTFRHSSGACLSWQLNSAGDICVYDQSGTPQFWIALNHSNAAWALGASYRIRGYVTVGSTTAGAINATVHKMTAAGGGATTGAAISGAGLSVTTANFTANNMVGGDFGVVSGNNQPHSIGIADIVLDDGATSAPVDLFGAAVTLTPNSGNTPLTTQASIATTPMNGATTTYAVNWGDGTTTAAQSSATPGHTYNADGSYTATVTVNNS